MTGREARKGLIVCFKWALQMSDQRLLQSVTTVSTRASARADVGRSPAPRSIRVTSHINRSFNSSFHHESSHPVRHVACKSLKKFTLTQIVHVSVASVFHRAALFRVSRSATARGEVFNSRARAAQARTHRHEHTQLCALNCWRIE